MLKVGHDKRLNYYQQAADETIAALRSHRYGLTNPEAQRRLEQNGGNLLPYGVPHSPIHDAIKQATTWPVVLLLLTTVLSLWQQNDKLAFALLVLAAVVSLLGAWRERHVGSLLHTLDEALPRRATIRRNAVDSVIDAQHVVVGDLVVLQPGIVLPADVRLVETDGLLVDDSLLHGGHAHAHKFTHALPGSVPFQLRHNMAYAGTSVMGGTGLGVVVATGAQTEVGKLLSLTQATGQKFSRLQSRIQRQSGRMTFAILLVLIAGGIAANIYDWPRSFSQLALLTFIVACIPVGALLSVSLVAALGGNRARRSGVRFQSPSALDRLGEIDVALIDDLDFVVSPTPTVRELLVGKQAYTVTGAGYDPDGSLLGRTQKPLGTKTITELQLLFEAAILCNDAKLLPPDAEHSAWHGVGPSNDRLLVILAARAGFEATSVRANHRFIKRYPFDHHRQIGSTLHEYDHRRMAFVHGTGSALVSSCKTIWDGGHTRKLSEADRTRLLNYIAAQAKDGNHVVALAYRKFTAAQKTIGMQQTEQDLTLLGLVTIGRPIQYEVPQAFQSLANDRIACSLLTTHAPEIAQTVATQLKLGDTTIVTSPQLSQLSDNQLLELISQGGTIFSHLTGEDRLRLVDVAQRSGKRVLITGRSLGDVPAMHHAFVSLASAHAPALVQQEAAIILLDNLLHSLTRALNRSRHLITNTGNILQGAFTDSLALALLVLIGTGLYSWQHIPLAVTPLMALALLALLQPLLASSLDTDTLDTRPDAGSRDGTGAQIVLAASAALLAVTSFLLYFARQGLSPSFIDSASTLYLQAATVTMVSLAFFQWINLLFVRANHTKRLSNRTLWRNRNIWWTLSISLLILGNVVYNPLLQHLLGTKPLSVGDWCSVVGVSIIYTAIRWLIRIERRHGRHAIVELHQQVHGKDAAPQV